VSELDSGVSPANWRVDGGEILDSREYYDAMTLMTQLGVMPSPGPGDAP
jgi:hypothetical protein